MATQDDSKIRWYFLWPAISCAFPVAFLLVALLSDIPSNALGRLVELIGGLMYWSLFVLVPPSLMFWGYAIYFDWCHHRVAHQELPKTRASIRLVVAALFLGGVALVFRGALPTSVVAFVEGPLAFGLLPAIVAVYRIASTRVDGQASESHISQPNSRAY